MQAPNNPHSAAVAPLSRYYVWQSPGGQFAIYLSLGVVRRLGALAAGEAKADGGRAAEVGGLLLGRTMPGETPVTVIEEFEPFPSAHVRGPSYTLVGAERRALGAVIRRHGRRRSLAVVGWFRSHTRPGLFLDQHDFSILSEFFNGPQDVCLLIREPAGAPAGGFFFWEEGDIRRQSPYLTFPFEAQALLEGGYRIEGHAPGGPLAEAPAPAVTPLTDAIPALRPVRRTGAMAAGVAVVVVLLAVGMLVRWSRPAAGPSHQPAALSLQVEKIAGGLRLSWDREAPLIRNAGGAVVRIDDGGRRNNITLTPRQLALGSVMYFASSGDVAFELVVAGPHGERSEALRAVSAPEVTTTFREPSAFPELVEPLAPPLALPPAAAPLAVAPRPAAPLATASPAVAATGAASRPEPAPAAPAAPEPKPARPLPESIWARRGEPVRAAALPSPPDLRLAPPARRAALAPIEPTPAREADVFFEPARPSGIPGLVGKVPLLRRLQKEGSPDYVAPQPVRQVKPAIPAALADATSVEIKVHIDESGRVLFAEAPARQADSPLVKAAADAALEWRFIPARANGKEVASDALLRFQFE